MPSMQFTAYAVRRSSVSVYTVYGHVPLNSARQQNSRSESAGLLLPSP